ncbi:serine/threonine dehydratase [Nocardia seriolae]|uniref:serine/threonine dehydratase n=1 Tax=Nocardia seriolae TaxID=37332 RepID=UPI0008FF139A|nr:serine/threonine dehydratase [Nocardia seriolae]OJF79696.1 threonine dehydratase [Nocardia seriolae]PSK29009.1 threonine dehydratase [Nocardia seriolae]QOW36369.1 serine/threonine dehydratase [Nocardia seriolae]QUN16116.1 serine/threonine dehydratase [Nocardia seriolae]WNJ56835.1 serine/threonine dehydratase [Nocardia seriolae]
MHPTYAEVTAAAARITGHIRPVVTARADADTVPVAGEVWFALEHMQHTGSFKARGAANFVLAQREQGTLPRVGITIASGGNAGVACAWAARLIDSAATVFLPDTAPVVKVARLRALGAQVLSGGNAYADAAAECERFAAASGALRSHAYDDPYVAAGAGTLLDEIVAQIPDLDTVVVAVGGGGLLTGITVSANHHGVRVVAVEPERCRAFSAALEAGEPVDVEIDSVAADALGARRITPMALSAAEGDVRSVLVTDKQIIAARQTLWDCRRLAVEHAAATALAALLSGAYVPTPGERVAVIICGANTDPSDLVIG